MILEIVQHCMTKSILNAALLVLICTAFRLSYAFAAAPVMQADTQAVAASGTADNSKHGSVSILVEYACKKGAHQKSARGGLVSEVLQRGADSQPMRVVGIKNSETGDVAFVHVLDSDCSGEQPVAAQEGASLALSHRAPGEDEYFYAISGKAECLRAFQIKFLGQLVPVDTSTKIGDCQNEVRSWLSLTAKWKAQATSADKAKQ